MSCIDFKSLKILKINTVNTKWYFVNEERVIKIANNSYSIRKRYIIFFSFCERMATIHYISNVYDKKK